MITEGDEGTPSKRQSRWWMNGRSGLPCHGCSNCSSSPWLLVFCGFFANVFTNGCVRAITIFMPDFIFEFESSVTLMSWIFSLEPFFLGVMTPFVAYFTSKFGTRPVVMVTGAFAASGITMFSQAHHISLAGIAVGIVTSMTQSIVFASSVLLIRRNFRRQYALAHGIVISGFSCGLFVFPPILEALSKVYSWRGTCLIASGFMLNTVLMGALMKPCKAQQRYLPVELDVKACEQPLQKSKFDSKTTSCMSLNKHEKSIMTDVECNGTDKLQNEGPVDALLHNSCNIINILAGPSGKTEHSTEQATLDAIKEGEAIKTAGPSLDPQSHQNLNPTDKPSTALDSKFKTERISVSGVGSSRQPGCLQRIVVRNYHTFAIYTLSMFSMTVGFNMFLMHVSTSFKEFGVDLKDIATCYSFFAAFNLIGRITNGLFVSRGIPPSYLITLAELVAFVSIIAVYLCTVFPVRVTATALYGLGTGFYTSLFYVFHREIVDPKVDVKTLSIFMFIEGMAGPTGGSFGGLLRDITGNYQLTYMTSAGLSFFAAVLMVIVILIERGRKRSCELVIEAAV